MVTGFRIYCEIFIDNGPINVDKTARREYGKRSLSKVGTLDLALVFINVIHAIVHLYNEYILLRFKIRFQIIETVVLNPLNVDVFSQCFDICIKMVSNFSTSIDADNSWTLPFTENDIVSFEFSTGQYLGDFFRCFAHITLGIHAVIISRTARKFFRDVVRISRQNKLLWKMLI